MSDLIEKIGALLAKAENTDNEHEADAYMMKAQQLATIAAIDLESARLRQKDKEKREEPESRVIRLFDRFDKSKTKSYFIWLIVEIGRVQDVRWTISQQAGYVTAYGYPSDIDVTEALYASLSTQMVETCEAWLKKKEYRNETVRRPDGWFGYVDKPVDGRTARRSFYEGFRDRVVKRLWEAKREAVASMSPVETDDGVKGAELVLVNKAEAVNEFYRATSDARGSYRGSARGGSSTGHGAGSTAGSRASLGSGASIGGKRAIA